MQAWLWHLTRYYLEAASLQPVSPNFFLPSLPVWWSHSRSCLNTHTHTQTPHCWFSCTDVVSPHLLCLFSPPQRQAKYSENKLKCTKARNDYLLNLAATNAVVAKYYIHDVSDMIDVSMRSARVCLHLSAGISDVDLTLQHCRFSHHLFLSLVHSQPVSCLFSSCSVGPKVCIRIRFFIINLCTTNLTLICWWLTSVDMNISSAICSIMQLQKDIFDWLFQRTLSVLTPLSVVYAAFRSFAGTNTACPCDCLPLFVTK